MIGVELRSWWASAGRIERIAVVIWCAVLLFVCGRVFLMPAAKTVYPIFSASARLWWSGIDTYEPGRPVGVQMGYRYGPTCSVAFTPFAIFPDSIGGVLWRIFNVAALLGSLWWFCRAVLPIQLTREAFAGLTLLVLPMALQSINNGQANLVVIASMLGCVAAVAQARWNLAGVLLAGAFVLKLYPLALGMVLMALYPRRLAWRIPLFAVLGLVIPFLLQHPAYVIDQYRDWVTVLQHDERGNNLGHMYRDVWLLIYLCDLPINRQMYVLLQLAGGALVAWTCWRRQQAGWPMRNLLTSTMALTATWMMLLGPATESSSFILFAPSFGWSVLEALLAPRSGPRRVLLWSSCLCFVLAVVLGGFANTVVVHAVGVHVWGSLLYFVYLLSEPMPAGAQAQSMRAMGRLAA